MNTDDLLAHFTDHKEGENSAVFIWGLLAGV